MNRIGIAFIMFFAVLLLCPAGLLARPTTGNEAETVVKGWLIVNPKPLGADLGRQVASVEPFDDDYGHPLYYIIYLEPSGFVIVSGDDLVEPIIGFADGGVYDPSSGNPLGALVSRDLAGRVESARHGSQLRAARSGERSTATQRKWQNLISLSWNHSGGLSAMGLSESYINDLRVAPLVKSEWNQETSCYGSGLACYNYYTPRISGGQVRWYSGNEENYPCGCVATAMAQLMRYHKHPTQGIGRIECTVDVNDGAIGVRQDVYTRGGDGNGGPYDWGQMPLIPCGNAFLSQRRAVGALCFDVGLSMNMTYTPSGSYPQDGFKLKEALMSTFQYANVITGSNGGSNIGPGIIGMINPNLDAACPVVVYVGGEDTHAVVCDGYGYNSSTLYHHLNLGWYGIDDAYYNLPDARCSMEFNSVVTCFYNIFIYDSNEIISGRVTNNAGSPLKDAVVTAQTIAGQTYTDTTDANGIYALVGVPSESTFTLNVTKPGYYFNSRQVTTSRSVDMSAFSGNRWAIDFPYSPQQAVVYVDCEASSGANDGSSWADAFTDLQDALEAAAIRPDDVNEIWVANGNYTPDKGLGFRSLSFKLIDGVGVYGGFAGIDSTLHPGGETQCQQRGPETNITILSGDLAGDDANDPNNDKENSYHVINGSSTGPSAVLDGFTITGGNANGSDPNNVDIDEYGAGMYICSGRPIISNCEFVSNRAVCGGGGMYSTNEGGPTLNDCEFNYNSADYGGGLLNDVNSCPTLTGCVFFDNHANIQGGAIYNSGMCATVTRCDFKDNDANWWGGGIYNCGSSPTLNNCLFASNAADFGGAMFNDSNSFPTLTNCNLISNRATSWGGGIYDWSNSASTLTSCILWGNILGDVTAGAVVTYSDIQGGWLAGNNISADPLFADRANGDFHLNSEAGRWDPNGRTWVRDNVTSPCIDAGDPSSDWTAEPSPNGGRVNIGMYGGTSEASMSLSTGVSQ